MVEGPDGNLWFTDSHNGYIGAINVSTYAIVQYPSIAGPQFIVSGPDGNLWVTNDDATMLRTMNPATHVVTTYSTGLTAGAYPLGLAVGPDGNIWFRAVKRIKPTSG
jgi:virginiamycin B lyase